MSPEKIVCLIVAGGTGNRINSELPKQFIKINGKTILEHTISAFIKHPLINDIKVVYNQEFEDLYNKSIKNFDILPGIKGGNRRQDSVRLGLKDLKELNPTKILIHDAARPLISEEIITNIINLIDENNGSAPVIRTEDSLKECDNFFIIKNIDRSNLFAIQTPQGFPFPKILEAHIKSKNDNFTDDTSLFEKNGYKVKKAEGSKFNFKVTTDEDLIMLQNILSNELEYRTGTGFDVHQICDPKNNKNNFIKICGIAIPFEKILEGHSDADVGLHALVDAILGAIGQNDIGVHFPTSNIDFKDLDSRIFLEFANKLLKEANASISNIDITIICEAPKISPYKEQMRNNIAKILDIESNRVNVKATTTEKLGFTGRQEGIAAQAVVTVKIMS